MSKNMEFRSSCGIASTLDIFGDKWSLLIIRDMLLFHKSRFKELAAAVEAIAPNILSARLKLLESRDLIFKIQSPLNRKENIYLLRDPAIDLAPILLAINHWSAQHMSMQNDKLRAQIWGEGSDQEIIHKVRARYHQFRAQFQNS